MKKRVIVFLLFASFAANAFAQHVSPPWWLSLEFGKQRFRSGDYGSALMLFEDARRDRRAMYEQMERDIISLLSLGDVRRIGDSLDRVEQYSYDRHYTSASAAFEEIYYRIGRSSLGNSANAALTAAGKLKDYPEAEYWIGEVYRIEGELSLALSQYRRANAMRDNLENPDFYITLLYKISDIHRIRQEYNDMIRVLDLIISDVDTLWANARLAQANVYTDARGNVVSAPYEQASASFARTSMINILENEGINRFLELYRYNNINVEQAHRLIGFHYAVTGLPSAQDHLMFAFLIQNTVIIEELMRRQFDFRFTTNPERRENYVHNLIELAAAMNNNHLLQSFIIEVEYYKTAYYFAASLFRNGKASVARTLWEFLATQPQAGEWHSRALSQLRNPRFEILVEMP